MTFRIFKIFDFVIGFFLDQNWWNTKMKIKIGSMRLTHKKTVFSHKLSTFLRTSKLSHKKTKKAKQSAFHTDLVNCHTKK